MSLSAPPSQGGSTTSHSPELPTKRPLTVTDTRGRRASVVSNGAVSDAVTPEPQPAPATAPTAAATAEHLKKKENARIVVNRLEERIRTLTAELDASQQKVIQMSKRHKQALADIEARAIESETKLQQAAAMAADVSAVTAPLVRERDAAIAERDVALAAAQQRTATIASLEAQVANATAKADAAEKKANLLAARLVASLRREQVDETSELSFVLRMLTDEREAVEATLKSISAYLQITLPFAAPSGEEREPAPDAPSSPFDGETMERGTRIVAQLHALEMGLRQRALAEHATAAATKRQLEILSGIATDVLPKLNWCAVNIMNERNAMDEVIVTTGSGDVGSAVAASTVAAAADPVRARSLGTAATISVGQSPMDGRRNAQLKSALNASDGGSIAAGDGFLEPTPPRHDGFDGTSPMVVPSGAPPLSSAGRQSALTTASRVLPLVPPTTPFPGVPVLRTSESLLETIDAVHDALLDAIEDLKAVSDLEPKQVVDVDQLRVEFDEYRKASQQTTFRLAERLDREVMRHHQSMIDMKQRVSVAEAEYTRLLLETQQVSPDVVERMQTRYLEITSNPSSRPRLALRAPVAVQSGSRLLDRPAALGTLPPLLKAAINEDPPSVDVSAVYPGSAHTSVARSRRAPIVSPNF